MDLDAIVNYEAPAGHLTWAKRAPPAADSSETSTRDPRSSLSTCVYIRYVALYISTPTFVVCFGNLIQT